MATKFVERIEHTPGPWVAECVGVSSVGPDGVDVYEIVTADGHKRIAEHLSKANGDLTAAAPDLLEALRDLLANPDWRVAQDRAHAAIAKATGSDR